jgi:hypothetical protein
MLTRLRVASAFVPLRRAKSARQGMVLFIPVADTGDPARSPQFYDSTFRTLTEVGMPAVG